MMQTMKYGSYRKCCKNCFFPVTVTFVFVFFGGGAYKTQNVNLQPVAVFFWGNVYTIDQWFTTY